LTASWPALLLALAAVAGAQDPASRPSSRPLAGERSAYLRQHLDDPVTWYPWGEEAFAKALREDKPIFLSIGYASCHWCHVMEHESFENPGIARVLDEFFVPIKVDREERPDVDRVYVDAAVAMLGHAGWPLNLFLTPDRKPFYAGTYFPLEDQPNRTGFRTVVHSIRKAWHERRGPLVEAADQLALVLQIGQLSVGDLEARRAGLESRAAAESATRPEGGRAAAELQIVQTMLARKRGPSAANLLVRAGEQLIRLADADNGGFGTAPKFPVPANALALLRLHARGRAPAALPVVRRQYDAMARGGIRDHLAGGFHRYTTDARWEVPHFEKMLYDQALIARVYLELAQATGDGRYEAVCRETLDFTLAHMRARDGGFIAALDASVQGNEGTTYLWSREEVEHVLAGDERQAVLLWAGLDRGDAGTRKTLAERRPAADVAAAAGIELDAVRERLRAAMPKLLAARDRRPQPAPVPHVLTGWNAWLASTLARAGMALNERRYLAAADETVAFLERRLKGDDGLFARRHVDGETRFRGELSDQAAVIEAFLDLHEATLEPAWLRRAEDLTGRVVARFGRPDGSFHDSVEPDLLYRTRDLSDGAVPCGISQMNVALARLARLTGEPAALDRASKAIDAILPEVSEGPADHPYGVIAWDLVNGATARVVFAGPRPIALLMRAPLVLAFRPHVAFTAAEPASGDPGRVSATLWVDGAQLAPVFDSAALLAILERPLVPEPPPEGK
jgi:hypothetical protein